MNRVKLFSRLSLALTLVMGLQAVPVLTGLDAKAWAQEEGEPKTRKTPALRSKVYEQLARAQTQADEGNTAEAIAILDNVKDKSSSMNSYELAMMYNFYGFIYYNAEDYDNAIASFEQVVEQQPIPESFEMTTLFSLAQLHLMRGNYDKTITALERWEGLNHGDIPAKNYLIKAQAMYQMKDFERASSYINQAVRLVEAQDKVPEENWYVLQRAIYYELKQPEKVRDVLIKMVKHYNQPKYWVQLGGMYGELGEEKKQLAILEAAYQQGYIQSASDVFNLAQLYYYHQAPIKGAKLMQQAMNDGVLEKNLRNLKFMSLCLTLAKENEKAVPVMRQAAALSEDGELDAQLAQLLLNMDRWDDAIASAKTALEKGNLRNQGITHLVLGMAYFNKHEYNAALNELAKAEEHSGSRAMAQQWKKYVQSEKITAERIAAEVDS